MLTNADVYTGAFSAKYGGRISSVMDIRTRDGNMRQTEGRVGASPLGPSCSCTDRFARCLRTAPAESAIC